MQKFHKDLERLLNFAYTCRKFQKIYGKSNIKKAFSY
jgi:hypothetical protein